MSTTCELYDMANPVIEKAFINLVTIFSGWQEAAFTRELELEQNTNPRGKVNIGLTSRDPNILLQCRFIHSFCFSDVVLRFRLIRKTIGVLNP
jgi:hypothetical protein